MDNHIQINEGRDSAENLGTTVKSAVGPITEDTTGDNVMNDKDMHAAPSGSKPLEGDNEPNPTDGGRKAPPSTSSTPAKDADTILRFDTGIAEIKSLYRLTYEDRFKIGEILEELFKLSKHGEYEDRVLKEIDMSPRYALDHRDLYKYQDRLKSAQITDFQAARNWIREEKAKNRKVPLVAKAQASHRRKKRPVEEHVKRLRGRRNDLDDAIKDLAEAGKSEAAESLRQALGYLDQALQKLADVPQEVAA